MEWGHDTQDSASQTDLKRLLGAQSINTENRRRPFSYHTKRFVRFLVKKIDINSEKCMASSDSQIDKPQRGHPKRAELPGMNINTGAQSINTEKASLMSTLIM